MKLARWMTSAGLATALAASLFASTSAEAGPYTAEYVFGDSLSDNGNLAEALGFNFPNPPSYHDSFTNGQVAVGVLASRLGLTLNPSLWVTGFADVHNLFGAGFTPGTNYAVAGATSAFAAVGGPANINLPQQVGVFGLATSHSADPNALYIVMIGGNDVRNAALQGTGAAAIGTGVATEIASIQALLGDGARHFLVVDVPDVGVIPEFAQDTPALAATATAYSQLYDSELLAGLAGLALPADATLTTFDLLAFNANILANAGAYGFTNTTDPCFTNTPLSAATTTACGPNGLNIGQFTYWDQIHPTVGVHALWGAGFAAALGIPEPSTIALFGLGLVGLVIGKRRRRTA